MKRVYFDRYLRLHSSGVNLAANRMRETKTLTFGGWAVQRILALGQRIC